MLLSSSTLASVKSTNVNEKLEQIIVPCNVKCSCIVSWQHGVVNTERFSTLQEKIEIKILDIRSSVIKGKTFGIELMRRSKGLHQLIASCLQVCDGIVSVFRVTSCIKIHCNRTELAGETIGYFAIMRLQFKIVGARRGPAPSPSPLVSVTDWMLPSTPLKRCAFLKHNCTKTLQWVARLQPHWKDALFKLASVTDTSITIWSALTTSYGYVVWPEQQEFSRVGPDISWGKYPANSRWKSG